jgi:hypothetical protein
MAVRKNLTCSEDHHSGQASRLGERVRHGRAWGKGDGVYGSLWRSRIKPPTFGIKRPARGFIIWPMPQHHDLPGGDRPSTAARGVSGRAATLTFIDSPCASSGEQIGEVDKMGIDWRASKEAWIDRVRRELLPGLTSDPRFPDAGRIVKRFEKAVAAWQMSDDFRPIVHDANELCGAAEILRELGPEDRLLYEHRRHCWIDVKTVAPELQNDDAAWERVLQIATAVPANANLVLDPDYAGAVLGRQMINARWSFVQRAIEAEAKISLLTEAERRPVWLLFCSNGACREDALEDFVSFYRTGRFRADDWAQNAITRYMAERNLRFARTLTGFCFLERGQDEVRVRKFTIEVEGPEKG